MRIFLDNKGVGTLWSQFKAKLAAHADDSDIHVTTTEKATWNNKAELTDIPTMLPANGGNSNTVNGNDIEMSIYRSTSSFGVSDTDTADTIWKALPPNSIFAITAPSLTDPSWNFPEEVGQRYSLLMIKLTDLRPLGMYLYPKSGGDVFFANVDGNGAYVGNWRRLCDGGNADTLDGMHASDITLSFVNKYKPLVVSVAPTSNSVILGWLPVDGATKYAVARYDPTTQKYINISTEITNTNYTVTGLSSDTTYQFLVQAWVNNQWSTFSTADLIITNTLPDYAALEARIAALEGGTT